MTSRSISIYSGSQNIGSYLISDKVVVGRDGNAQIQLDDRMISREHLELSPHDKGVEVRVLGRFITIFYDEAEVEDSVVLKPGERVFFGSYSLEVDRDADGAVVDAVKDEAATQVKPAEAPDANLLRTFGLFDEEDDIRSSSPMAKKTPLKKTVPKPAVVPASSPAPVAAEVPVPVAVEEVQVFEEAPQDFAEPEVQKTRGMDFTSILAGKAVLEPAATRAPEPSSPIPGFSSDLDSMIGVGVGSENDVEEKTNAIARPPVETKGPSAPKASPPRLEEVAPAAEDATGASFSDHLDLDEEHTKALKTNRLRVELRLKSGSSSVRDYEMAKDEISIGRSASCDIVLNHDKKTSRKNSIITRRGQSYFVKDLNSSNGTYVNGSQIQEAELQSGDVIQVGECEYVFEINDPNYERKKESFLKVEEVAVASPPPSAPTSNPAEAPMSFSFPDDGKSPNLPQFDPGTQSRAQEGAGLPSFNMDDQEGEELLTVGSQTSASSSSNQKGHEASSSIAGLGSNKERSFFAQWKTMNPRRRIVYIIGLGFLFIEFVDQSLLQELGLMPNEPPAVVQPKNPPTDASQANQTSSAAPTNLPMDDRFRALEPAKQRYVEGQFQVAVDHASSGEWDACLEELSKLQTFVTEYKESKELEVQCRLSKDRQRTEQAERDRREREDKRRAQVQALEDEGSTLMTQQKFEEIDPLADRLIALDPENGKVVEWRKVIESDRATKAAEEDEKQKIAEANQAAESKLEEALSFIEKGDYYRAMDELDAVSNVGAPDATIAERALAGIETANQALATKRDPLIEKAKALESEEKWMAAYHTYEQLTQVDPESSEGYKGMQRIKRAVRDRAKVIYVEGVLSENYGDYDTAEKKYAELMQTVPNDDDYYLKAKTKLNRLLRMKPYNAEDFVEKIKRDIANQPDQSIAPRDPASTKPSFRGKKP